MHLFAHSFAYFSKGVVTNYGEERRGTKREGGGGGGGEGASEVLPLGTNTYVRNFTCYLDPLPPPFFCM